MSIRHLRSKSDCFRESTKHFSMISIPGQRSLNGGDL
jgi:hypothetical protein